MALFCDICEGGLRPGQRRCDDCKADIAEQLRRMGGTPQASADAAGAVVDDRLLSLLADERLMGLVEDVVSIAINARDAGVVDRQEVGRAVKELARARGVAETRDALMALAAVALAFANRLPRHEGRTGRPVGQAA